MVIDAPPRQRYEDLATSGAASLDVLERNAARSRAERAARAGAKRALRAMGRASAYTRPAPDFLLIGAKRGGTTSFVEGLRHHPGVLGLFPRAEHLKGLYYFDEHHELGERWYRSHFPTLATRHRLEDRLGHRVVTGEGSPYYLFHPVAPERARAAVPRAQILVILRDPVERAYSHWKERRRNRTEPLDFAAALAAEDARLDGEEARLVADPTARSFAHRHCSYVAQGEYAPMLARWFAAFGHDRVWVGVSEEVFAAPQRALDAVFDRLGLPGHRVDGVPRRNAEPSPGLDPGLRRDLTERLRPAVAATEVLLGRKLPWLDGGGGGQIPRP